MSQASPAAIAPVEVSRHRKLGKIVQPIFYLFVCLAIVDAANYILGWGLFGLRMMDWTYYYTLIALLFPWVFLFFPMRKGMIDKIPWYDWIAAGLACGISFLFSSHARDMLDRGWEQYPPTLYFILALILGILVVEAARRTGGPIFCGVVVVIGLYPLVASDLPGILKGVSFGPVSLVGHITFGSEGYLGIPMKVCGGIIIGFLIFAGLLMRTGAGDFFLKLAMAIAGYTRGGAAKVAVIGSGFFGSLSGSSLSNVIATGSVTIPAMKRTGYPAYYAGAVEACASTGGTLMPPVMGAAAFVMASLTDIPYGTIIIAAFIPSILYYWGLLLQADAYAAKTGLKGLPREQCPKLGPTLKQGWHFLFALLFLIWGLVYMKWESMTPFYASVILILVAMTRKETRLNWKKGLSVIEGVGQLLAETIGVIVPLGLIIAALVIGGLAGAFTARIVALSGGIPIVALLLGAIACYILGLVGMVTPAYIFLAVTLAPALLSMGFNVLAIHLFIIYFAMIGNVTPPVAVSAFVAAGIAQAPPMRTAVQAMRLGVVIYFIPFFFVFEPAFVFEGALIESLFYIPTCALGIVFLAGGIEGYLLGLGQVGRVVRPLLVIIGILIAFPDWRMKVIGACLAIPLLIFLRARKVESKKPAVNL